MDIEALLQQIANLQERINELQSQLDAVGKDPEENTDEEVIEPVNFQNFYDLGIDVAQADIDTSNTETKEDQREDLENSVWINSDGPNTNSWTEESDIFTLNGERAQKFSLPTKDGGRETFTVTTEFDEQGMRLLSEEEINERLEDFEPYNVGRSSEVFGRDFNDDTVYETNGSDISDTLYGDGRQDVMRGGDGDDTILSGKGNDVLYGGDGNDSIYGSRGDDVLIPGDGGFFDFENEEFDFGDGRKFTDHIDLVNGGDVAWEDGYDVAVLNGTSEDWNFMVDPNDHPDYFDKNEFVNAQSDSLEQSVKLIGIEEIRFTNDSTRLEVDAF